MVVDYVRNYNVFSEDGVFYLEHGGYAAPANVLRDLKNDFVSLRFRVSFLYIPVITKELLLQKGYIPYYDGTIRCWRKMLDEMNHVDIVESVNGYKITKNYKNETVTRLASKLEYYG